MSLPFFPLLFLNFPAIEISLFRFFALGIFGADSLQPRFLSGGPIRVGLFKIGRLFDIILEENIASAHYIAKAILQFDADGEGAGRIAYSERESRRKRCIAGFDCHMVCRLVGSIVM